MELKERAQFAMKNCLTSISPNKQHMSQVYTEDNLVDDEISWWNQILKCGRRWYWNAVNWSEKRFCEPKTIKISSLKALHTRDNQHMRVHWESKRWNTNKRMMVFYHARDKFLRQQIHPEPCCHTQVCQEQSIWWQGKSKTL